MTPEQDLLEETKRKLEELENLIRNPPGRNDETMVFSLFSTFDFDLVLK